MLPALSLLATLAPGSAWAGSRGAESAPAPAGLEDAYSRRVALIVGIDTYPEDEAIEDLRFAAKDAREVSEVLRDPAWGDFDQTTELIGGYVSLEGFWNSLEAATATLNAEDTFLLYFAGHGTLELTAEGTRLYLLPSSGELDEPERTGIDLDELEDYVAALPARQRVVIIDACHSATTDARGSLSEATRRQLTGLRGSIPSPPPRDVSASEVFLYAAAHSQPAQEDEGLENGVYTHYLVRGLQGEADADGDGLVEVLELHDFVSARTEQHTGGLQVPQLQARTVGREAIFLSGDAQERALAEEAYRRRLDEVAATGTWESRGATVEEPAQTGSSGSLRLAHGPRLGTRHDFHPATLEILDFEDPQRLQLTRSVLAYELSTALGEGPVVPLLLGDAGLLGLEQGRLDPSLRAALGARTAELLDLGLGAAWSPRDPFLEPVSAVLVAGTRVSAWGQTLPLRLHALSGLGGPAADWSWRVEASVGLSWGG